jgi:hypothetical protein
VNSIKKKKKEKLVFAPGCALMLYKPELADKLHKVLQENLGDVDLLLTCCHHDPQVKEKTRVINVCPGCDKRFEKNYPDVSTISVWEILADSDFFKFPDHTGMTMSIIDACPTRNKDKVQDAIRSLLEKMNIRLIEPENTRSKTTCCGDAFYGSVPVVKLKELMKKKAEEMPADEVAVYCVSCVKAVFIGGKKPRYLVDLLFNDPTIPMTIEPDDWHRELRDYIEKH